MEFIKSFWMLYLILLTLLAAGALTALFDRIAQRRRLKDMPKRIRRLNTFA